MDYVRSIFYSKSLMLLLFLQIKVYHKHAYHVLVSFFLSGKSYFYIFWVLLKHVPQHVQKIVSLWSDIWESVKQNSKAIFQSIMVSMISFVVNAVFICWFAMNNNYLNFSKFYSIKSDFDPKDEKKKLNLNDLI